MSTMDEFKQQFWPKSYQKFQVNRRCLRASITRHVGTGVLPVKEVNKLVQSTPGFEQISLRTWTIIGL